MSELFSNKMKLSFHCIENKLMSGEKINSADMKFYNSFKSALSGKNAGNAGKRKVVKTGK